MAWTVLSGGPATLHARPLLSGRDYHSMHHENGAFRFDPRQEGATVAFHPYHGLPAVIALSNGDYTDPAEEVSTGFVLASPADLSNPAYREYRGLLPKCSLVANAVPCLTSVTFNIGGTVTFVATVPIGDPMGR